MIEITAAVVVDMDHKIMTMDRMVRVEDDQVIMVLEDERIVITDDVDQIIIMIIAEEDSTVEGESWEQGKIW
jgi:hypothetical protein